MCCFSPLAPAARGFGAPQAASPPKTLVVHDVGMFEASFVPTHADFERLDARFRIPDGVWEKLPTYADWGFAVFRLKPKKGLLGRNAKPQSIHPMAFSFPRREPRAIFFPTVHVHDGAVHEVASFDHVLTCQASGVLDATLGWTRSSGPLGSFVDAARARGLVDGARGAASLPLLGVLPNQDVWLREPTGVSLHDLRGRTACSSFEVRGATANDLFDTTWPRRKATSQTKLGAVSRALEEGLPALETSYMHAWELARLTDDLAPHFLNGDQLWTGTSWMDGKRVEERGPGRVTFQIATDSVEPQTITLGFARLPDDERIREIRGALTSLLANV